MLSKKEKKGGGAKAFEVLVTTLEEEWGGGLLWTVLVNWNNHLQQPSSAWVDQVMLDSHNLRQLTIRSGNDGRCGPTMAEEPRLGKTGFAWHSDRVIIHFHIKLKTTQNNPTTTTVYP